MIRQLESFDNVHRRLSGDLCVALARHDQRPDTRGGARTGSSAVIGFPHRPDDAILSATIPLFYIGQNSKGLWVVHEAEGRRGGLFLFRRSAVRFAREESEPSGCALMFLKGRLELDVTSGSGGALAAAMQAAEHRAPALGAFAGTVLTQWHKFVARITRALASERRNRAAIERELFHGQYTLSSKNDDDLPIVD